MGKENPKNIWRKKWSKGYKKKQRHTKNTIKAKEKIYFFQFLFLWKSYAQSKKKKKEKVGKEWDNPEKEIFIENKLHS